jgi:hypothetical protein
MDGTGSNVSILDNLIIKNPIGYSTLPVELLSFTAVAAGKVNQLRWKTTHEIEVSSFNVERSADGTNYINIGAVAAQQGYTATNDYSFTDNDPAATSYYRIRMTDLDGSYSYSPVKKVSGAASAVAISCYPNPVMNTVNVKVSDGAAYRYSVIGVDGKIMQSGAITGGQASLNVAAAPKGLLILRVESVVGADVETFKLIKQ